MRLTAPPSHSTGGGYSDYPNHILPQTPRTASLLPNRALIGRVREKWIFENDTNVAPSSSMGHGLHRPGAALTRQGLLLFCWTPDSPGVGFHRSSLQRLEGLDRRLAKTF